ncbi:MAG: response regulator [Myxococcales bacterium]
MTTLMVVEDEAPVGAALQDLLEDLSYSVCCVVGTGEEALAAAVLHKPDVVLMDVELPGSLDGIDTAKRLAESYRIPVIFLTAHADRSTLARSKEAAAFGYLVKPCEALELQACIETAVVRAQVERERDALIVELREATAKIKVLRGLLPICGHCKRIRDDQGYWQQLESYIASNSEALFSHGICTDCLKKHYPEYADD